MTRKKKYPEKAKFFLADLIHVDASNSKPTLIGFFPNDSIALHKDKGVADPTDADPVVLQSICILTSFINCRGSFDVTVSLFQPDGNPFFEDRKVEGKIGADSGDEETVDVNFIVQFNPFKVSQYGDHRYVVKLDNKNYDYEFQIQRAK